MRLRVTALAALALLAACTSAPPQPESMRDPTADFSSYRTFGWTSPNVAGDEPLMLLDSNIRNAITAELERRGYVHSAENADIRISYETASTEKIESNPVRVGVGVGGWGGSGGASVGVGSPSVRNYREGTLVIHAIDPKRNAEVWQGRISSRLSKGGTDAATVRNAVASAMSDFPPAGR